jgi:thiol-disulfide isomerase/thioredoxin
MNKPTDATPSFLTAAEKAIRYSKAPELAGIDGFINTGGQPLTISQFKGKKVVLIDFWTYSCINCLREIPYVNQWQQKYGDQGLEIVGVSTPEFAFEHVQSNVQSAVNKLGIKYPVVLDNEYGTWNAFGNQFWPRVYIIDIDGYIVYDHAGEGDYDKTEKAIQKALVERDERLNGTTTAFTAPQAPRGTTEVDQGQLGSPETYFGAARNEYLGNGEQGRTGAQTLAIPQQLQPNTLYLGGAWNFTNEYAINTSASATIRFLYKAKNVYFVASSPQGAIKIKVTRDGGQPLGSAAGADVDANGEATISEDRLYQLVGDSNYGVHTLEVEVESSGLEAYTFTFG